MPRELPLLVLAAVLVTLLVPARQGGGRWESMHARALCPRVKRR